LQLCAIITVAVQGWWGLSSSTQMEGNQNMPQPIICHLLLAVMLQARLR
jgi:hypothetical protein